MIKNSMNKILKEFRFMTMLNNNEVALIIVNNDKTSICIVDKEVVYRLANKIVYSNNDITIYVYDPRISKKTLFPIQWYFIDYEAELEDLDIFDRQSIVEGNKDLP